MTLVKGSSILPGFSKTNCEVKDCNAPAGGLLLHHGSDLWVTDEEREAEVQGNVPESSGQRKKNKTVRQQTNMHNITDHIDSNFLKFLSNYYGNYWMEHCDEMLPNCWISDVINMKPIVLMLAH